jgi:hypothetical protein
LGENQAILQLNCEPFAKELSLHLISVNVVTPVLCQVVELLGVLIHIMVPLAQIQELTKLVVHGAR